MWVCSLCLADGWCSVSVSSLILDRFCTSLIRVIKRPQVKSSARKEGGHPSFFFPLWWLILRHSHRHHRRRRRRLLCEHWWWCGHCLHSDQLNSLIAHIQLWCCSAALWARRNSSFSWDERGVRSAMCTVVYRYCRYCHIFMDATGAQYLRLGPTQSLQWFIPSLGVDFSGQTDICFCCVSHRKQFSKGISTKFSAKLHDRPFERPRPPVSTHNNNKCERAVN